MKIVLATGIYPPSIGGPATYVRKLANVLVERGEDVTVITFAPRGPLPQDPWRVVPVARWGGFPFRWIRYARALRREAKDADVVYAFSAVSVGMPLLLARLRKPRKVLRLGGDFLWERYTDLRGKKTLREWYAARPFGIVFFGRLLRTFHHVVFNTRFQEQLYEKVYPRLPRHSVIENALPQGELLLHAKHDPLRILFLGRFVRFKNLRPLLMAVGNLPHVTLTLVGEGPASKELSQMALRLRLKGRITFLPPVQGEEKDKVLREHDVLVIPSFTEISPHAALEARAGGLPVLLTEETGLGEELRQGMILMPLRTAEEITRAILEVEHAYPDAAAFASSPFRRRSWEDVTTEHQELFRVIA
ncbi:MAG: glycosyltransferase family 4 protein [Candidatus Peribacteraceae bacterium]|nr:glycosyltransferase family 4 protein [Candidatus Peribacteraceae bacterium]